MIIDRMKETKPGETICLSYEECEEVLRMIEDQQERIDIMSEGQRHGHWIGENGEYVPFEEDGITTKDSASCSCCGRWLTGSDEYACDGKYCPACGAIMDEPPKEGAEK